jgi:O-antigen ligase
MSVSQRPVLAEAAFDTPRLLLFAIAALLAVAAPTLLAFNLPPSATYLNQAVAFIGWGVWMVVASAELAHPAQLLRGTGVRCLLAALLVLLLSSLASMVFSALPSALALSAAGAIAATVLVTLVAVALTRAGHTETAFHALCIALVIAGVLSLVVAAVQVFVPDWADGAWIAASANEGRASGNLRQPNHLSSLLLWSIVAAAWLGQRRILPRSLAVALATAFVAGLVLSASRTGVLGVFILSVWGQLEGWPHLVAWVDRFARKRHARGASAEAGKDARQGTPMARSICLVLALAPIVYWIFFKAFTFWAHNSHHVLVAETRFTVEGDISSSRFAIWSDTLSLIAQHPWAGVGFGEFNFAWSLTPFPHRPVAFFDHTHNLPLQFAVELGLPLALLVLALLSFALWRAFVVARDAAGAQGMLLRSAFMIVLLVALHSQLEYPLWYAYFLLPTAFAFGLCLGNEKQAGADGVPTVTTGAPAGRAAPWRSVLLGSSLAMLIAGVASLYDYAKVVVIFENNGDTSLAHRIQRGQHSVLFAHHADYAAATTAEHPSDAMGSFKVATHYLLDTRLMIAWANALNESGDVERARFIAQRLREFRNDDAKPFFAPCDDPAERVEPLPFQCTPPTKTFDYRDFR